jgi:hypothetical protein
MRCDLAFSQQVLHHRQEVLRVVEVLRHRRKLLSQHKSLTKDSVHHRQKALNILARPRVRYEAAVSAGRPCLSRESIGAELRTAIFANRVPGIFELIVRELANLGGRFWVPIVPILGSAEGPDIFEVTW